MNAVKMIQKENQLELPLFFLDEEPKTAEAFHLSQSLNGLMMR